MIWNDDDADADGWVAQLVETKRRVGGGSPIATARDAPGVLEQNRHLSDVESVELHWNEPTDAERVVASVRSRSYVNLLDEEERTDLLARVRRIVEPLGAEFAHPYVTFVTWACSVS